MRLDGKGTEFAGALSPPCFSLPRWLISESWLSVGSQTGPRSWRAAGARKEEADAPDGQAAGSSSRVAARPWVSAPPARILKVYTEFSPVVRAGGSAAPRSLKPCP